MDESLGQMFRRERELRHIPLEEVAGATRISGRFLAGLEADDWSELPGGVFLRGFIRSYAEYLGLNPEPVLLHYQEQLRRLGTRTLVGDAAPGEEMALRDAPGALRRMTVALARRWPWLLLGAGLLALPLWYFLPRGPAPSAAAPMPASQPRPPPPRPNASASPVTLEILAGKGERRVYVRLVVDGQTRFQGELRENQAINEAGREFELYTPSAGSLQLRVDGKVLPALGRRGETLTGWRYLAGQGVVPPNPAEKSSPAVNQKSSP